MDSADLELVDSLYAATTGEGTLNEAMRQYLKRQDDAGGAIIHYDSILDEASDYEPVGPDSNTTQLIQSVFDEYESTHGAIDNPLIALALDDLKAGAVLVSDDVIPYEELSRTEFFEAIFKPLGIRWSMGWLAMGNGQNWMTFTSSKLIDIGPYEHAHFRRARLFRRHLARVLHIMELIHQADNANHILEDSLDKVPQGILLVDDSRKVLFSNSTSNEILKNAGAATVTNGRLTVGSTSHERAKFEQWWNILISAADMDGASFTDASLHPLWELEVSRVGVNGSKAWQGRRWMIRLKLKPEGSRLPIDYLQEYYGMTKAEADVCANLCLNGDAVSTARAMALSPNTVRTHLKSAFRKTDTKNQVALAIRLMTQT